MEIIAYGRVAERLLIVLFAGMSLLLGYFLFFRAIKTQGEFEAGSGDKFRLSLRNVGPGVFFALFGSVVLIASLFFQITLPPATNSRNVDTSGATFMILPSPDSERKVESEVAALSALMQFYRARSVEVSDEAERIMMQRAYRISEGLLGDLVDHVAGDGAFAIYQTIDAQRLAGQTPIAGDGNDNEDLVTFFDVDRMLSFDHLIESDDND